MTAVIAFAATAIALACPLHMLWRMRHQRPACASPIVSDDAAAELRDRQRALAERVRTRTRTEPAPDRH